MPEKRAKYTLLPLAIGDAASDTMALPDTIAVAFDLEARSPDTGAMNAFVLRHIKAIEMMGVLMRVFSFSLVSWLGPKSPFMFVWIFNTTDAVMLMWCSTLKRDNAYMVLNGFWILVGLIGILRAGNFIH